jgi:hypothetical protein
MFPAFVVLLEPEITIAVFEESSTSFDPIIVKSVLLFAIRNLPPVPICKTFVATVVVPIPTLPVKIDVPGINKLVEFKVFVVPFHVKSASSVIADVPLPINILFAVKLLVPVPPLVTANVPSLILVVFKFVKRDPLAAIFEVVKILFVLSHVKFPDCVIAEVPPINILLSINEPTPVPPLVTANVPPVTFEAFKFVKPAPDPLNKLAVIVQVAFIFVVSIPPKQ